MASPAATAEPLAPTTVPDSTPAAQPSTLAQLFTPVQPARQAGADRTQPLGSTSSLRQDAEGSDGGAGSNRSGRDAAKEGPVAALVRAIAGRLGRTGTTTSIKRTHDVKETRVSGTSANSTSTSKNDRLHKNDNQAHHRSNRDAKLADLNNKQQHSRAQQDLKKADTRDAKSTDAKAAKADTSAKNHRDQRDTRDAKLSDAKTAKADTSAKRDDKNHRDTNTAKGPEASGSDAKAPGTKTSKGEPWTQTPSKPDPLVKTTDPRTPDSKPGDVGPGPAKGADPKGLDTKTGQAANGRAPGSVPRPRTQPSREAGYRDGQRAATAAGHLKAYRDGTRDGWEERTAAYLAEKRRLDAARDRNATRAKAPAKPPMDPAGGSTVDLTKKPAPQAPPKPASPPEVPPMPAAPPTATTTKPAPAGPGSPQRPATTAAVPAQVTAIGEKAISFNAGGAQHSMSRGEVRTLKQFERRLSGKQAALAQIAEGSRETRATATDQAARAQKLAEAARDVEGGDLMLRSLTRLAELAQQLRGHAEEIEKRATQGTEALSMLAANADTRHGGIYKAVVDSPLTSPAEREFYQDKQGS